MQIRQIHPQREGGAEALEKLKRLIS